MPTFSRRHTVSSFLSLLVLFGIGMLPGSNVTHAEPIGDVLTTIQRPLLNIPVIVTPGQSFEISCVADPATTGWSAELHHGTSVVPLTVTGASYDASTLWWTMAAELPGSMLHELYDLRVTASGGIDDTTWNAVQVIPAFKTDWYFVHVTDPHLPDHTFSSSGGAPEDSTEMDDLRAVINDINLLRPEFVLLTGDLVNEGELEDYMEWRAYTRSQRLLAELEVPVYLVAGNHDVGGWDDTPPSDGTARRDWWRFFGWARLDNPPPGAPERTQNFSFDYGPVHFVGLEAYINYDSWRYSIYGGESFTSTQMNWLDDDLAAASGSSAQVLFHHRDFNYQLNLSNLGVEMSLSGHIHRDDGSLSSTPYDLSTNNTCDGERSYRLVRVSGSSLQPRPTLEAGYTGQNLRVTWTPANDGSHDSVTAQVINNQNERFQYTLLKFVLPAGTTAVDVNGGSLAQSDLTGPLPVFYVTADVLASSTRSVTVTVDATPVSGDGSGVPPVAWLGANVPNPFNPSTSLTLYLPSAGLLRLAVYDLQGRLVAPLADGQ